MNKTVGIKTEIFNYFSALQENSNWCWAASIQMVLNYYGVSITQEQIVERTYGRDSSGRVPDLPCTMGIIHRNLNNWNLDNFGKQYLITAKFGEGAPNAVQLVNQLALAKPVIIAYSEYDTSHILVITAVEYSQPYYNNVKIEKVIVRDPWPDNGNIFASGRYEFNGSVIKKRIIGYWFIDVFNN